jgi:uncharacterized protein YndB with AHSA1/START domain
VSIDTRRGVMFSSADRELRHEWPVPLFKFGSTVCAARVWQMLTTSESTPAYLFGIRLESTWETGSPLRGFLGDTEVVCGEVLFACRPDRLSYVLSAGLEQPEVYVTWGVHACGAGAIVCLHVDEADATDEEVETSWQPVVTALQGLLSDDALLPHVKSSGKAESLPHVKPPPSSMS